VTGIPWHGWQGIRTRSEKQRGKDILAKAPAWFVTGGLLIPGVQLPFTDRAETVPICLCSVYIVGSIRRAFRGADREGFGGQCVIGGEGEYWKEVG
jgi:hypothetical protein